ncbi:hypothetical protein TWF788_008477 [Orbilia oligospora]|nr:hypothetical protein TWF788_008477 [Orbilia oligospora]
MKLFSTLFSSLSLIASQFDLTHSKSPARNAVQRGLQFDLSYRIHGFAWSRRNQACTSRPFGMSTCTMHWGSGMEPIEPAMKIGRLTTKKKQFRCCMGGPSQGSLPAPFQPRKPSANPLFEKNSHRRRPEKERLPKEVLLGGFAVKGSGALAVP